MAVQGSTTGQLENASMEMIKEAIYTIEHDAPNLALVRQFTLPQGRDTMVIPKVGQMTLLDLAETQENTNEMALGMTTTSVSPSIVGGKVIITDTALHDNALDLWGIAGRQVGDAAARRMDTDIIALYPGLQGGTKLGGAGSVISLQRAMNFIAVARTDKYGSKLRVVHHPNVIMRLLQDLTASTGNRPVPARLLRGPAREVLRRHQPRGAFPFSTRGTSAATARTMPTESSWTRTPWGCSRRLRSGESLYETRVSAKERACSS